jgi:hypothetical protein
MTLRKCGTFCARFPQGKTGLELARLFCVPLSAFLAHPLWSYWSNVLGHQKVPFCAFLSLFVDAVDGGKFVGDVCDLVL